MSLFILDTNVISEIWKPRPDPLVMEWLENADFFLAAPVIAEIQEGVEASASAARRKELDRKLAEIMTVHGPPYWLGMGKPR